MTIFIIGLILFFVPHFYSALRSRADGKDQRVKIGYAKFMGIYSLITGLGLVLIIWGYIKAPSSALVFEGPHELHHRSWMIMLPAFVLLMAAYTPAGYIKNTVQHPMMLGILIWSAVHLAMGGDSKKVALFGLFAAYSLVSLICAYRRGRSVSNSTRVIGDVMAIIAGFALTGLMLHGGHQMLIGAPPM